MGARDRVHRRFRRLRWGWLPARSIGWIVARVWPKIADRYTVSTSSGVIAGASIMALIIIGLSLAGIVTSPE
jgi:hypothetical protein